MTDFNLRLHHVGNSGNIILYVFLHKTYRHELDRENNYYSFVKGVMSAQQW